MNNVEDTPSFVFQRALVFASGVNILNLCSFLIFNNFICFNKVVLRLGRPKRACSQKEIVVIEFLKFKCK